MASRRKLFIISGPSGSGKSSLVNDIVKESDDFIRSISVTTRPRRADEKYGEHYHFITRNEFYELVEKDMLLEWTSYGGYLYGTPKKFVTEKLEEGKNVILVIEVHGAMQVVEKLKDVYLIFITTSSFDELERRIKKRGVENQEEVNKRLEIAREEIKYEKYYDCIIVNSNYNEALINLKKVLDARKRED